LAPDKPPVPVKVTDMKSFVRLVLALNEGSQLIWNLPFNNKTVLCFFTAYMYWDGDLPILACLSDENPTKPFIAYRSDKLNGEEFLYTDTFDDARYKYASIIEFKKTPELFHRTLNGDFTQPEKPLMMEVKNLTSLLRTLVPLSIRESISFPLWHFKKDSNEYLGAIVPFEHYYESDALPVFFYLKLSESLQEPFIRYNASKPAGEKLEFTSNTSDAKYFYAKVIEIEPFPFMV
jgi:hypothetical protein